MPKITIDGVEQIERVWYYLLDFNDHDNWVTMDKIANKQRLSDLTDAEFKLLFTAATNQDKLHNGTN